MKHFNDAAAMGLGAAFCSLGKLYMHGLNNVEQDVEKGIKHYEAACELGEKSAYYYLGVYWLYQGDNKKALSLFEKLSLTHQNTAYYRGIIYCMIAGSGQYHKYQEAIHCLETACSIGSVYAHYTLAIMHYMGIGLQKDVIKGLKMLHAAAEDMDVTEALVELAHIYCSGCTEEE
jgi:TPR repeat protein